MDERGAARFNKVHAPAGSAAGGQFAAASGSSAGKGKDTRPTPGNQHPVGQGETGKRVSDLQERLNALGFKPPLKVDGIFGPKTLAAVRAFQKSHGLRVDGLVGPKTTAALRARAPAAQHSPAHTTAHAPAGTAPAKAARRSSDLKYGHGSALWTYWTRGEGFAKWSGAVHKWTTLHGLLLAAGVPAISADGLTTNIITAVMPGYMKQAHAAAEKKTAGRSAVTTMTERAGAKPYGDVKYADPANGKYPIDTEAHARSAWAYVNMPKNAAQYPLNGVTLSEVKGRIMAACKKFGIDVTDGDSDSSEGAKDKASASRSAGEIFRYYPLDDIRVMRAADGEPSGRVVEAYATVFDEPAEIHDGQGHYTEVIDRGAFDQVLARIARSRGGFGGAVRVLFNHGKTMEGVPAPEFQRPIGKALDIRPDGRGLLTRTEYAKKPFAEEILDDIREGRITGQSFVGGIIRSDPELRGPGDKYRGRNGALQTVRRMTLGLREYGPVLYGAYTGAEFLGVRMALPGDAGDLEPDLPEDEESTPAMEGDAAGGTPEDVTSTPRYHAHRLLALRTEEICRETGIGPLRSQW